jgi:glyoxylase I family protein
MTSAADASDVRDLLLRYETALASRDGTAVDGGLERLIAEDFLEIGASGRRWTASQVRTLLAGERLPPVTLEDFAVTAIASDVVLATFHIGGPRPTERSSIWVRRDGRWTVRFHQGTPAPA